MDPASEGPGGTNGGQNNGDATGSSNASAGSNDGSSNGGGGGRDEDAGSSAGSGGEDAGASGEVLFYRTDSLQIRGPRMYAKPLGVRTNILPVINAVLRQGVGGDIFPFGASDGLVDISLFLGFFAPLRDSGQAVIGGGLCMAPLSADPCTADPASPFFDVSYATVTSGSCLAVDDLRVDAPCLLSAKKDLRITLSGLGAIPLEQVEMGARLSGEDPPAKIEQSLLRGFLTQAVADSLKIPEELPAALAKAGVTPGGALSSLLDPADQDTLDGEVGWWFIVTSTAEAHALE